MALAKPNEICNFIGCREINKTDIGIKRLREISAGVMRGFVDNAKRCKQKNDMESFINCMPYSILFLLYFDVLTSY